MISMLSGRVALAWLAVGCNLWAQTLPGSTYKTDRKPVTISYEQPNALGVSHEVHYYRSDGSFAHTHLLPGSTACPQVEVIDVRNKVTFLKDQATQLYDDLPLTQRVYEDYGHIPTSCEASLTTPKSQTCSPLARNGCWDIASRRSRPSLPTSLICRWNHGLHQISILSRYSRSGIETAGLPPFAGRSMYNPESLMSRFLLSLQTTGVLQSHRNSSSRVRWQEAWRIHSRTTHRARNWMSFRPKSARRVCCTRFHKQRRDAYSLGSDGSRYWVRLRGS